MPHGSSLSRVSSGLLVLLVLLAGAARAADEAAQVQMLRTLFTCPALEWRPILEAHRDLLDDSFFERVDGRVRWSRDKGRRDDAFRFALVGDLAGQVMNRPCHFRELLMPLVMPSEDPPPPGCSVHRTSDLPARFLKATVLRLAGKVEEARALYEELALEGYQREECLHWLETLRP